MKFISDILESMDGNIIEYCILGGIIVLVGILIASIVSCMKSLKGKKQYSNTRLEKMSIEHQDDDLDIDPIEQDPIKELIEDAKKAKKEDVLILEDDDEEEVAIASKIEIPEIKEEKEAIEEISLEAKEIEQKPLQKLDIKSITREMELKLEEETTSMVEAYEDEQEKTAIISYKELVEAAARIEANADKEEDYIDDVVFEFNSKKIADGEKTVEAPRITEKKSKFIPTLDISPVFGKREAYATNNDDIFEIEEVDETVEDKSEQFLESLNNLRNNLN